VTLDPVELGFRSGDIIEVKDMLDKDCWWGRLEDREGWFPSAFVAVSHSKVLFLAVCVCYKICNFVTKFVTMFVSLLQSL